MKVFQWGSGVALLLGIFLVTGYALGKRKEQKELKMPEFKHQKAASWINSPPLSRDNFWGQVVLVEIWTSV